MMSSAHRLGLIVLATSRLIEADAHRIAVANPYSGLISCNYKGEWRVLHRDAGILLHTENGIGYFRAGWGQEDHILRVVDLELGKELYSIDAQVTDFQHFSRLVTAFPIDGGVATVGQGGTIAL